jgi:hypothetical protein
MDNDTFIRVFVLATVIASVTPFAALLLFMLWQDRKARRKRKSKTASTRKNL